MASIPVYGSQVTRFQETVPNVGANAVRAHRVVGIDQDAVGGPVLVEMGEVASATFTPIGVNQFEILAASDTSAAQGVRVASVATSGLLLVEIDTANAPAVGVGLTVDAQGRGSDAVGAVAVALNGSTPTVREISGNFALVSFS
jgi:hypothetical protein